MISIEEQGRQEGSMLASVIAQGGFEGLNHKILKALMQIARGMAMYHVAVRMSDIRTAGLYSAEERKFKQAFMHGYDTEIDAWMSRRHDKYVLN